MEIELSEIKRKLRNEMIQNECETDLGLDEFITTAEIRWLIDKVEGLDNGCLKTYQKATERINELEKQIDKLKAKENTYKQIIRMLATQ